MAHKDSQAHAPSRAIIPSRFARARGRPSESGIVSKNACPICFNDLTDICAYQPCTHVLCFECAVRNRVLCNKKECPVCRAECDQVVLAGHRFNDDSDNVHRFDAVLQNVENQGKTDPSYGFRFENISIERTYRKILTHSCRYCDRPFDEFDELVRHVRERHEHHYCSVCVRTLMLFTWEHKLYSYDELLRHMDEGDPVDRNVQPHPLCELCGFRAYDKDDLYKHSKKRHQICWICERTSNKLVFFNDFFTLFDHMAHNHHVCKICSKPEEARVTSFFDEQGLQIHLATDHTDGNIRPDVLFNFQQRGLPERGGRQRRGNEERHEEDEENVRPRSPPRNFNMDSAQFPTLGDNVPGLAGVAMSGCSAHQSAAAAIRRDIGRAVDGKTHVRGDAEQPVKTVLTYGAPKMTENEFPSLGMGKGPAVKKPSGDAGPSWTNGSAKVVAPAYANRTADVPKNFTRTVHPPAASAAVQNVDMFPVLSGPAAGAVAKLNRDWTAVPVKHRKNDVTKTKFNTNVTKPALSSRWDLSEQAAPSQSGGYKLTPQKLEEETSPRISNEQRVFVQRKIPSQSGPGFDGTQDSTDLFPSLAKPEGKSLPSLFRSSANKKKASSTKNVTAAASRVTAKPARKAEKDEIAESLFKTPAVASWESDDPSESYEPVRTMAASVSYITPYTMEQDDFPGLEKVKPRAKVVVPERRADRVQKHKEVKSDWGNTLIQYETVFVYIPPPHAAERLVELAGKLDPVEIKGRSKTLSDFQAELLLEKITALEFWMESQRIMGKKFAAIMPEVIVLLPNVQVQQDILEVAKVPIYGNTQVVKALSSCGVCKQIVTDGADKVHHEAHHKSSR